MGGFAITVPTRLSAKALLQLTGYSAVLWWGDQDTARLYSRALSERDGPLIPLIIDFPDKAHVLHERHLCVDTTAAGGNASLLAGQ